MFILKLVTSSAFFLPSNLSVVYFDNKASCELALKEMKKEWLTVNDKSSCINLEVQNQIDDLKQQVKKLQEQK